jgi:hypothetical protein
MFKLLLWKFGFEWMNILRFLERRSRARRENYFAFGGNLDPAILKLRRIYPFEAKDIVLRDYRMTFSHPGPWVGMGFANIEPAPGEVCYGRIYTFSQRDADRMDFYEGVPFLKSYQRKYINQDGLHFYYYESGKPRPGLKPSALYLGYILRGLENSAPKDYLDTLRAIEPLTELIPDRERSYLYQVPGWAPAHLARGINLMDRLTVKLYVRVFRKYSLTEWIIRPPGA